MKHDSKKVAAAMCKGFIKQAHEIMSKPKLEAKDLKDLRRLRELAQLVKSLGC
jgi:hypothetical protein